MALHGHKGNVTLEDDPQADLSTRPVRSPSRIRRQYYRRVDSEVQKGNVTLLTSTAFVSRCTDSEGSTYRW